jgi:hypothetical protein
VLHIPSYHFGIAIGMFSLKTGTICRDASKLGEALLDAVREVEEITHTDPDGTRHWNMQKPMSVISALEGYAFGAQISLSELFV